MVDGDGVRCESAISFGPFRIVELERLLEKEGTPCKLGNRAFDILLVLLERAGEVVSNEDLVALVWPDVKVAEANLRVQVAALRKALGDGRLGTRYVMNIAGRGYCFVAPISRSTRSTPTVSRAAPTGAPKLPIRLSRIVGRDETVQKISAQLTDHRFMTIVGPGGIGKTTVAVSVGYSMTASFDGAVHFVDLGPLGNPLLVPSALASTLGLLVNSDDPTPGLLTFLRDRRMLLILDSCEHVIETAAGLAERVFGEAPQIHILATSREPLRVEGERVHQLFPLRCPPDNPGLNAADVLGFPAAQLFVERVTASVHGFELDDSNAPTVGKICRGLDGIALALELAAGRVDAYGINGVAAHLDSQFGLLWQGRRTALPRHQTLSATFDWSYNLLPEMERRILRCLSIFVGMFSLEAAQSVAGRDDVESGQISELIANLVAKSLTVATVCQPSMLYRLLDTTRAYVLEKLSASGEENAIARRHASYYCEFLQRIDCGSIAQSSADGFAAHRRAQIANVRVALEWSFSERGDIELGTALAAASAPLFTDMSLLTECCIWMERGLAALDASAHGSRREMELQASLAVSLMFTKGNSEEVRNAYIRGLELAENLQDPYHQLRMLGGLHTYCSRLGDFRGSLDLARRSQVIASQMNDRDSTAIADWMLGVSHHLIGDQASALIHCRAALRYPKSSRYDDPVRFGFDHRFRTLMVIARTLWLRGFPDKAAAAARHALEEASGLDQPVTYCLCLVYTITVLLWIGDLPASEEILDKLITHTKRYSLRPYQVVGIGLKGELCLKRRQASAGVELLQDCLDALYMDRYHLNIPVFAADLAEGLAMMGQFDDAHATIDRAMAYGEPGAESFYLPELYRIKGYLLASDPGLHLTEAEDWLLRSLDLARRQSALALELRAATSLALLWRKQGNRDQARELLGPVYGQFTEGFGTADLRAANGLLDELQQRAEFVGGIPCTSWHLDTGDLLADVEQSVLESDVAGLRIRLTRLEVIEIACGRQRGGIVARREPCLGQMRLVDVIGRAGAAHPGRDPPRLQRIRQHTWPKAGNGEGQHGIMQLAFGVGPRPIPAPLAPEDVVHVGVCVLVHARAQIDQSLRPFDQCREDIGGERVDREDMRKAIGSGAAALPIADGGIVNGRIKMAAHVDLHGNVLGAGDRLQVADNDVCGLRQSSSGIVGARFVARMQDHLMTLFDKELPCHQAEAGG